jgi:RNA polymerase sigma-70 factor (ECF subfamily)
LYEPNDAELVSASASGDREAYAVLVRRHASRVYAFCLAMLHDPDDSQDMAQEALIKGMTRIHSLRDGTQFAAWIMRIAQNLCRDHRRTWNRRRELLQRENPTVPSSVESSTPDISAALAKLPEKYRVPLMLYYFDGQSSENLARTLNLSRAGASTRLVRARRALRRLLEKSHE